VDTPPKSPKRPKRVGDIKVRVQPKVPVSVQEVVPDKPIAPSEPASAVIPDSAKPTPLVTAKPKWWRRRRAIVIAGVVVVLIITGGVSWKLMAHASKKVVVKRVVVAKPKPPAAIYDPLTGLAVANQSAALQPVIGVMVENLYPDARPQSGLGEAGVVYEALAEGGITRFLAIFQEPLPPSIGPVRSLRPYYLDWGLEYGIPVAHAGGSQPALNAIPSSGLKDINALVYDGSYFLRTTDRYAPHNLYTNNQLLAALDSKLGYATPPTFQPLPRKADKKQTPPTHPTIKINFSSSEYAVEYDFDPTTNAYLRYMGGVPHIERNTNTQIQVKNIVVEYVPTSYSTQPDGKPETDMSLIGQGQALVFEDGGVTVGTWNKASDAAQTKLLDSAGKPISFNRGNTWYEVVPTGNTVTY
jgi:hypothetical protein